MSKITVVINTLNEEANLPRTLSSVKGLADELVVVDMHSTDKTREIAKKAGAKVFLHEPTFYVEPARNFAISKANGEWILLLDADEEISKTLSNKLKELAENPTSDFYRIPRKNIIFNKWIEHSRWWPDYNIRFFKKGSVEWSEEIHTIPITVGEGSDLEPIESLALIHHNYSSIDQYMEKLNRYSTVQANGLHKKGYKFSWQDIIKKPSLEFLSRFFAGEGYKDGVHGLALATLQSFSEVVTYLKVWQLEKFSEQKIGLVEVVDVLKKNQSEQNYWYADSLVREHGGIKHRIKRKLKIS